MSVGTIMSSYHVSDRFADHVVAAAFVNPCIAPMLSGVFLSKYREGYIDLSRLLLSVIFKIKGKFIVFYCCKMFTVE